jgi:hypothetical protein
MWGDQVTGHCAQFSIPPGCSAKLVKENLNADHVYLDNAFTGGEICQSKITLLTKVLKLPAGAAGNCWERQRSKT